MFQPFTQKTRSFTIDYANNRFLKDGKPFQYVAGSMHYFRSLPQTWERKLRTMRAAGLHAVTTYVEWALHNPSDGLYDWSEMADLERFIELAAEQDLLVILRPGPYICAERDNVYLRIPLSGVIILIQNQFHVCREDFRTGSSRNIQESN